MKERHGSVWYEDRRVGVLRADSNGIMHFRYEPEWLDDGFPISLQLPFGNSDVEIEAHGFFQGLLPEGRSRIRICRQLRIDENDDAGLLFAIGEDCAGALSVLPNDAQPDMSDTSTELIDADAIRTLVRTRGEDASKITGQSQRFSLAGAQEKLPVIFRDGEFRKPSRRNPSTHILKFETHRHVCFAEYATLALARALGFDVIDCEYHLQSDNDGDIPYLLIPRYDRRIDSAAVHRLHQEDMIQALGYPSDFKYQKDGGPGMDDVRQLLSEETADPARQVQRVIDWQIFNVLVGNFDGHGKNLALLYQPGTALPTLAPFYDLVAIDFINRAGNAGYDRDMAFAIGGEFTPERIGKNAWKQFAIDMRVRESLVFRRLDALNDALPDITANVRQDFAERFGDNGVYDQFETSIRDRCRWVRQVVA